MPQWLLSAIFAVEFLGESIIWKEMKLKFVLAMVTALPLAFMACKKEQGPNPGKDATVRIAVLLPDGIIGKTKCAGIQNQMRLFGG